MRIQVITSQRRQPKIGDRRTTKKHGTEVRVVQTTSGGAWCVSGSRYVYEWRKPASLIGTQWEHLLSPDERGAQGEAK